MTTKKFHAFEDSPPITYREGTSDQCILEEMFGSNCPYIFPKFCPEVIFDMGGNIGVTAIIMAKLYPQSKIYSFEPIDNNLELLEKNCSHYKNIHIIPKGLWIYSTKIRINKSDNSWNHGGYSCMIPGDVHDTIDTIGINEACIQYGHPDLIKIDIEGAELPVLGSMEDLQKTSFITGELHGQGDFKLLDTLDQHFELQLVRAFNSKVWYFHAANRNWTAFFDDHARQSLRLHIP